MQAFQEDEEYLLKLKKLSDFVKYAEMDGTEFGEYMMMLDKIEVMSCMSDEFLRALQKEMIRCVEIVEKDVEDIDRYTKEHRG